MVVFLKKHSYQSSTLKLKTFGMLRLFTMLSFVAFLSGCSAIFSASDSPEKDCNSAAELLAKYQSSEARASLYIPSQKVRQLPEPSLDMTPEVKHHMRVYGGPRTRFIQEALIERDKNYPYMAQIFQDEGVPETMLNLALIESGFRNEARSPVGAVGMWQFMKSTARLYGLKVGLFVDERKDPILSTIAAARHLKDLYAQYGDWHLVLAAYNMGTGGLDRALGEKGERNFWRLARSGKLNRQTADFVPKFIAASLLINTAVAERQNDNSRQYAALDIIRK